MAAASAHEEMIATVIAARLRITPPVIRRNWRRGRREPGPTQKNATAAPAAQPPAFGSESACTSSTDSRRGRRGHRQRQRREQHRRERVPWTTVHGAVTTTTRMSLGRGAAHGPPDRPVRTGRGPPPAAA